MIRKIKVLHYGLSENKGGIENVVFSWLKNKPDDMEFDFVNDTGSRLGYEDEFTAKGSKIFKITHRYSNPIKHKKELEQLIEDGGYDFIHCHVMTMIEPVQGMICENNSKCSAIYHCHSMYKDIKFPFKERMLQKYTKLMLKNKHVHYLSCGIDAGDFMFEDKPFTAIENGVNFDIYKYNEELRRNIRTSLNVDEEEILIGHVGHDCFEKNYPFMIETFSELLKTNPKYKLLLIGNMDKSEWINNLIKKHGVEDKVIFTGMINNVKDYYSAMDLFYLPSVNEGFPVVLIEAQASGLPCVVSNKVTKDTKISEELEFINLDVTEAVNKIKNIKTNKNRFNVNLDKSYDVRNSSKKLFNYYRSNLKIQD